MIEQLASHRQAAESAAAEAEALATAAASRAAAAIATAARAAEEAEIAAEAAARATQDAAAAAAAERHAVDRAEPRDDVAAPTRSGPVLPEVPLSEVPRSDLPRSDLAGADPLGSSPSWSAPVPGGEPAASLDPLDDPASGRAARRRAAEVADAETAVIHLDQDPDVTSPADGPGAHAAAPDAEADAEVDAVDGPVAAGADAPTVMVKRRVRRADRRRSRGFFARLTGRPVLAAAAVVGVLAVAGGIVTFAGSGSPSPSSAAVVGAAQTTSAPAAAAGAGPTARALSDEPDSTAVQRRVDVDPESPEAVAYLGALREADIPTSRTGLAETEAAAVICEQLDKGADEDALVRALPAVLPTVTKAQAVDVVAFAQEFYC